MHLPEIDRYAHLDSPIHRWDARPKLATLAVLLFVTVFLPSYGSALIALAVALGLVLLSRIPLSFVFIHARWVVVFCPFLTLVMALTGGGEPAARVGPLTVSGVGLRRAGLISVRALAAVLLIYPMFGTARFHVSMRALQRLGAPRVAVQIMSFSYRYVFVLFEELRRMLTAARARGLRRATGIRSLRNFGSMVGMLFVRSFDRTERVYHAMLARGYAGRAVALDDFSLCSVDLLKMAGVLTLAAALLLLGV